MRKIITVAAFALATVLVSTADAADKLKLAIGQRGIWHGAPADLGMRGGIFPKHGLELEILYTDGAVEGCGCRGSAAPGLKPVREIDFVRSFAGSLAAPARGAICTSGFGYHSCRQLGKHCCVPCKLSTSVSFRTYKYETVSRCSATLP